MSDNKHKSQKLYTISEETANQMIDDKSDLTYCLTIFVSLYGIIRQEKEKYPYSLRFCVNEGINIVKERYPEGWKDMESLIEEGEGK